MIEAPPIDRIKSLFFLIDVERKGVLNKSQIENALSKYLSTVGQVIRQIVRTRINEMEFGYNHHHNCNNETENSSSVTKASHSLGKTNNTITDVLLAESSLSTMETLMDEALKEVPKAVEEIMLEVNGEYSSDHTGNRVSNHQNHNINNITYEQWLRAWERHPELNDLMSIRGMAKLYAWMNMIGK